MDSLVSETLNCEILNNISISLNDDESTYTKEFGEFILGESLNVPQRVYELYKHKYRPGIFAIFLSYFIQFIKNPYSTSSKEVIKCVNETLCGITEVIKAYDRQGNNQR